jgi:hypothetical protein
VGGAFCGLGAVVTQTLSGRKRVAVLLDFLGQQTSVILERDHLVRSHDIRTETEIAGS